MTTPSPHLHGDASHKPAQASHEAKHPPVSDPLSLQVDSPGPRELAAVSHIRGNVGRCVGAICDPHGGTAGCAISHHRAWSQALARGVSYELVRPSETPMTSTDLSSSRR